MTTEKQKFQKMSAFEKAKYVAKQTIKQTGKDVFNIGVGKGVSKTVPAARLLAKQLAKKSVKKSPKMKTEYFSEVSKNKNGSFSGKATPVTSKKGGFVPPKGSSIRPGAKTQKQAEVRAQTEAIARNSVRVKPPANTRGESSVVILRKSKVFKSAAKKKSK